MELNPYAPTKASLNEPGQGADQGAGALPGDERLASRKRRFANSVIDSVGILVLIFVVATVMTVVTPSVIAHLSGLGGYLLQIALILLYYVPAEFLTGRTPGKIITRTRVISRTGQPLTAQQVVGRTLLRLIPLEALTFLARGPGLHDRASGTRVVMTHNT
jgi:uncharacterized RDD family membrane protein YckC